jgi:hypothetical protein
MILAAEDVGQALEFLAPLPARGAHLDEHQLALDMGPSVRSTSLTIDQLVELLGDLLDDLLGAGGDRVMRDRVGSSVGATVRDSML